MEDGPMSSRTPRMAMHTAAAALALLVASCNRQPAATKDDAGSTAPAASVGTSGAIAQNDSTSARPSTAAAPDTRDTRDAEAIRALEKMGDYLRTLKAFQIRSETNRD